MVPYLDIGCNAGWLLSEVPNGIGIDASEPLIRQAQARGVQAIVGQAEALPFRDRAFDCGVLSCVLEQCPDWRAAFLEAARVARRIIGINPLPGRSPWGSVQGWVRSVIEPEDMERMGCCVVPMDEARYYFEFHSCGPV